MAAAVLWGDDVSIDVAAAPERVWELVADVTRTSEWSPVIQGSEWVGEPAEPVEGARFVGHNQRSGVRWSRVCEVTRAEPGREFAFRTLFRGEESTRWRYLFEPIASGTRVTESYEAVALPRWVRLLYLIPGMGARSRRDGVRGMEETLARLKEAAEAG